MKSILEKAKEKSRAKKVAEEKERLELEKRSKESDRLENRIRKKIKELLSEFNGKRTKRGTLKVEAGVVSIKGAKGYSDEFLFSVEYAVWSGTFRGSDESPEEDYTSQGVVISTPKDSRRDYYNNDFYSKEHHSIGDYEFNKDFEDVEEWLVEYFKDLV